MLPALCGSFTLFRSAESSSTGSENEHACSQLTPPGFEPQGFYNQKDSQYAVYMLEEFSCICS